MHIEFLREFIEFTNYLNFSKTAKKLNLTQPALSNHLSLLEKELGVTLIDRKHSNELTPSGRKFYKEILKVIELYDQACESARHLSTTKHSGRIVIKMPISSAFKDDVWTRIITEFKKAYPGITVKLFSGDGVDVFEELAAHRLDSAVVYNPGSRLAKLIPEQCSIKYILIDKRPICARVHESHPLAKMNSITPQDLEGYTIALPAGIKYREIELTSRELFEQNGLTPTYRMLPSDHDSYFFSMDYYEEDILIDMQSLPVSATVNEHDRFINVQFEPEIIQSTYIAVNTSSSNLASVCFAEYLENYSLQDDQQDL